MKNSYADEIVYSKKIPLKKTILQATTVKTLKIATITISLSKIRKPLPKSLPASPRVGTEVIGSLTK